MAEHIVEVDGYKISLGENTWRAFQENPDLAVAFYMVMRDTRGFAGDDGPGVLALVTARLFNMSRDELCRVTNLEDVLPRGITAVGPRDLL